MAEKKMMWEVWCGSCDVTIHLDVESRCSMDQGAQFIIRPTIECAKCQSTCIITQVEVDEKKLHSG